MRDQTLIGEHVGPTRAGRSKPPQDNAATLILYRLQRAADLEKASFDVCWENGVLRLSGTVASVETAERIVEAAWTTPGVEQVINRLMTADNG